MTIEELLNQVVPQKMQISDKDRMKLKKILGKALIEEALKKDYRYLNYILNINNPDILQKMNRVDLMKLITGDIQVIDPYDLQADGFAIPILSNDQIKINFLAKVYSINNNSVQEKVRHVTLTFESYTVAPKTLIQKVQDALVSFSDELQKDITNGPLRFYVFRTANSTLQNEIKTTDYLSLPCSCEISDGTETPFDPKSLMKLLETRPSNESFEEAIGPNRIARGARNTTIINNRHDYNK